MRAMNRGATVTRQVGKGVRFARESEPLPAPRFGRSAGAAKIVFEVTARALL